MATIITTVAEEQSTMIFTAVFTDEDDSAVVPSSIVWSLTDQLGATINSRVNVAVAVPASSIDIVLSGDDLALQTGEVGTVNRHLVIEAVYDSDAGSNLPLKDEAIFSVYDLKKVS